MRTNIAAILVLLCFNSHAKEGELEDEVWIDGSSFYKSISHKKKSTIYFEEWSGYVDQFLEDETYFVALQLNASFDPLPGDNIELPSLSTLSAISNDSILTSYFSFLENWGRTQGINYLILPDTNELTTYEKQVVSYATEISPFYFLNKSILNHSIPESKKDFTIEVADNPTIWVASQDQNLSKIRKWSSKQNRKSQFFSSLRAARMNNFTVTNELQNSLKLDIFNNAVLAVDPNEQLPLRTKEVTYLGHDPSLRNWLSKYSNVLDYRKEGVQAIVDLRVYETDIVDSDLLLTYSLKPVKNTQIILPISVENESLYLSQMLFGAKGITGRHQRGRQIHNPMFLGYSTPSHEGLGGQFQLSLDTLAENAIEGYATPGMQIAVLKNGNLVWQNQYGYYTYDSLKEVEGETLYDIASLTKVMATLPAIALLIDRGEISLDDSLSQHLPQFSGSNKASVTIRQLLAHNGGLRSYIPFWSMMTTGDRLDAFYYKTPEDEKNDIRTYGLEPDPIMLDTLKSFLIKSNLIKNPENYNYSDLGYMVLHLVVEEVSGMPFDQFLKKEFYDPIGMSSTTFNPKENGFTRVGIAPTEFDQRYRNYQVWGEVHDRNALVFGGIAGHAGLFSTATDIAKMMSMLLNDGYFGGHQYLSKNVLHEFNFRHFDDNRRGLGWDKKGGEDHAASKFASDDSFGHTGFTGTMAWADPEEDLVFIFLSNRIYPDAENRRLSDFRTRKLMHDSLYQSLKTQK